MAVFRVVVHRSTTTMESDMSKIISINSVDCPLDEQWKFQAKFGNARTAEQPSSVRSCSASLHNNSECSFCVYGWVVKRLLIDSQLASASNLGLSGICQTEVGIPKSVLGLSRSRNASSMMQISFKACYFYWAMKVFVLAVNRLHAESRSWRRPEVLPMFSNRFSIRQYGSFKSEIGSFRSIWLYQTFGRAFG